MNRKEEIQEVVRLSEGGYSYDRYKNWGACARMLLRRGFTVKESATILLSKWTRWAGDSSDKPYGYVNSKDLERWIDNQIFHQTFEKTMEEVRKMQDYTFGYELGE